MVPRAFTTTLLRAASHYLTKVTNVACSKFRLTTSITPRAKAAFTTPASLHRPKSHAKGSSSSILVSRTQLWAQIASLPPLDGPTWLSIHGDVARNRTNGEYDIVAWYPRGTGMSLKEGADALTVYVVLTGRGSDYIDLHHTAQAL